MLRRWLLHMLRCIIKPIRSAEGRIEFILPVVCLRHGAAHFSLYDFASHVPDWDACDEKLLVLKERAAKEELCACEQGVLPASAGTARFLRLHTGYFRNNRLYFVSDNQSAPQHVESSSKLQTSCESAISHALVETEQYQPRRCPDETCGCAMMLVRVVGAASPSKLVPVTFTMQLCRRTTPQEMLLQLPSHLTCVALRTGPRQQDLIIGRSQRLMDLIDEQEGVHKVFLVHDLT